MAKNSLDQLIITKKMMDEDPNFASFSDVTNDAESDNTNSYMRPVVTLGGTLLCLPFYYNSTSFILIT